MGALQASRLRKVSTPRTAPQRRGNIDRHPNVVIGPDGKLFLAFVPGEVTRSTPTTALLNWQALLMT
jgi:hypothetical protein